MSSTTLHSFPVLTPRSLALAGVALIHAGLFYAFTSGLAGQVVDHLTRKPITLIDVPEPQPSDPPPVVEGPTLPSPVILVPRFDIALPPQEDHRLHTQPLPPIPPAEVAGGTRETVAPPAEPRQPIRWDQARFARWAAELQAYYPAREMRAGHEGTVVVAVRVDADGRVGEVRVVRSSGYPGLDAHVRERLLGQKRLFSPALEQGRAVSDWLTLPAIRFELKD